MAKFLIVDDSPTVVEMLKIHLQMSGHEAVGHTSSLGTLLVILRECPDVIILDIEMPMLEGPDLCRLIRKESSMGSLSTVPILFYSSRDEEDLQTFVATSGADGYIHKQWRMEKVMPILQAAVDKVSWTNP